MLISSLKAQETNYLPHIVPGNITEPETGSSDAAMKEIFVTINTIVGQAKFVADLPKE